jgi:hypothetical protein
MNRIPDIAPVPAGAADDLPNAWQVFAAESF